MTLYDSITETIGETPLVRLNRMCPPGTHVYVKIERGNPAGSIKDRAALSMIEDAVARGALKEGGTIIEPTSGNTGIAIAMIAAARGYKAVIVMPDTMSKERISLMKAYGAEVMLSPGAEGMAGAVRMAEGIRDERGGFIAGQFDNPANTAAHRTGTGKEILRDLPDVDFIYAGIGTGGTASGANVPSNASFGGTRLTNVPSSSSTCATGAHPAKQTAANAATNHALMTILLSSKDSLAHSPTRCKTARRSSRQPPVVHPVPRGPRPRPHFPRTRLPGTPLSGPKKV